MTDYINLQQTEYTQLQVMLDQVHEAVIKGEAEIREDICSLVADGGGMYVKDISLKVSNLLYQMETVIAADIFQQFTESQQEIANYLQIVVQNDIASS